MSCTVVIPRCRALGRAMAKGSKFGRQEQEVAWQNAEVDALYRLAGAGVRSHADVDMQAVLREIGDARDEEVARRLRMAAAAG